MSTGDRQAAASDDGRGREGSLVRRLAVAKLRELKRQGLTYSEIAERYRRADADGSRISAIGLLTGAGDRVRGSKRSADTLLFFRALDALDQGLAFFTLKGALVHANRPLDRAVDHDSGGEHLKAELKHFARATCGLARLRNIAHSDSVEELAVQQLPTELGAYRLRASFIGMDLFGRGGSILVALESFPGDPLCEEALQSRFGLTPQESRIGRMLADGRANAEIASRLTLSPHTVRRHTERIFRKLGVRSRAEAASRMLRADD